MKITCKRCKKAVYAGAKIDTYRKKLGNRALSKVDYYHPSCFSLLKKERYRNEHQKKARFSKRKNNR